MTEDGENERGWLIDKPWIRRILGKFVIGGYMRFIRASSKQVFDPPDTPQRLTEIGPHIGVSWHGQSNLAYLYTPNPDKYTILAAQHPDGRMAAALARSFRFTIIDGPGDFGKSQSVAGARALLAMIKKMKEGHTLFLTADVPPIPGRDVSPGIIALARRTGKPLIAMATASSRRKILSNWDKMQINYPFSRIAYVITEPLYVPDDGSPDSDYIGVLKKRLDQALERAFAIADGDAEPTPWTD